MEKGAEAYKSTTGDAKIMHHRNPRNGTKIKKLAGGGQNLLNVYVFNALKLTYKMKLQAMISHTPGLPLKRGRTYRSAREGKI